MKTFLPFYFIFLLAFNMNAQVNLVPNPSFENMISCPDNMGEINRCSSWYMPTPGTSDYFTHCANGAGFGMPSNVIGFQYARTGNSYAGIGIYELYTDGYTYREYIQTALTDTLESGSTYSISFFINYSSMGNIAIDNIGLLLSGNAVNSPTPTVLSYVPQIVSPTGLFLQDTLNWYKVEGAYTATGGEKYITIGNFKDAANTDTIHTNPSVTFAAYYYIDDVSVTLLDTTETGINEYRNDLTFNLFPNPSNGNMQLNYTLKANEKGKMLIYDLAGKKITEYILSSNSSSLQINDSGLESGVYFYQITVNNFAVKSDKLIIVK